MLSMTGCNGLDPGEMPTSGERPSRNCVANSHHYLNIIRSSFPCTSVMVSGFTRRGLDIQVVDT